jgi:hypothetical protein
VSPLISILSKFWIHIVIAVVCSFTVFKIQGYRIDKVKAQLTICQSVNSTNQDTIKKLSTEVSNIDSLCKNRLATKDSTIKRLHEIDSIKQKGDSGNVQNSNQYSGNDLMLVELNRMWK